MNAMVWVLSTCHNPVIPVTDLRTTLDCTSQFKEEKTKMALHSALYLVFQVTLVPLAYDYQLFYDINLK